MTTYALNNLWTYLQGLSLSQGDRQWLAGKLIEPQQPRLFDPETGEELNAETMQTIQNVINDSDEGTTYDTFEDFEKAMRAL